jgi:aspartyl-tRNA(Asn)/glutamyl-tRNA(Gln) amidotransferase subunit C
MTVTQDQIKKIARNLCKLPWSDEAIIHDCQSILGYVDMLNEVDTTGVEPTVSVVSKKNILREDEEIKKFASWTELLKCSPQKVIANQVTVWGIME